MKLILSPAKEMNCDALEERDWEVSPAVAKVVEAIRAVPVEGWREGLGYGCEHVRILSALYGAVSPDAYVKPYRLDMLRPLRVDGKSLKAYWKSEWAELFEEGETVVNCASDEFSTLLDRTRYNWVDVEFYERKDGKLKQHSTTSKKGRGLLVGFAMREQVTDVKQLEAFSEDGFVFDAELSTPEKLVFVR